MKIDILPFSKVLTDSTRKFTKIKKEDYLINGKYPIVDQGKGFVCGYTNDTSLVNFEDNPIIIFGDHTRVLKFIDFPLAIGADGVKVLLVDNKIADTKYVYYYLKSIKLHNAGYSRHFKYLKVKKIPLPQSLDDQKNIANLLTQVETLIAKREESIELLDELLRSSFLDMFGDPITNSQKRKPLVRLDEIVVLQRGFDLSKRNRNSNGKIPLYGSNGIVDFHDESKIDSGIITGRSGTIGKVYYSTEPFFPLNTTLFSKDVKGNNIIYLTFLLRFFRLERFYQGAGVPTLNRNIVHKEKIYKVDIEEQKNFADIVNKVESTREQYQNSLDELRNLFGSLSQRAFRGELRILRENPLKDRKFGERNRVIETNRVSPSVAKMKCSARSGLAENNSIQNRLLA